MCERPQKVYDSVRRKRQKKPSNASGLFLGTQKEQRKNRMN